MQSSSWYISLHLNVVGCFFFSCSVTQLSPTLGSMDCSMPGFPVLHCHQEFAEIHVHWVNDAIQSSHPLSPPLPPAYLLQFYIQCGDPHLFWVFHKWFQGSPASAACKECSCSAGDPSLIPGLGRSPGEGIVYPLQYSWTSLVGLMAKNLLEIWETWVRSLGWADHLEKGMATHCSILAWRIPTDRGAWQATVHGATKESDMTKQLSTAHKRFQAVPFLKFCTLESPKKLKPSKHIM